MFEIELADLFDAGGQIRRIEIDFRIRDNGLPVVSFSRAFFVTIAVRRVRTLTCVLLSRQANRWRARGFN
jgi:hypothetical protein